MSKTLNRNDFRTERVKDVVKQIIPNPNDFYVVTYARYSVVRVLSGTVKDVDNVENALWEHMTDCFISRDGGAKITVLDR